MLLGADQVGGYVGALKNALWPGGERRAPSEPRTEVEKAATRESASRKLSALMPGERWILSLNTGGWSTPAADKRLSESRSGGQPDRAPQCAAGGAPAVCGAAEQAAQQGEPGAETAPG